VVQIAPIVRGLLSQPTQDPDHPYQRIILRCLCHQEILDFVDSDQGKMLALTSPLTTDHLIRTKALPLWIDGLVLADQLRLREQLGQAIREYSEAYGDYVRRQAERKRVEVQSYDAMPRVILIPGVGALCVGEDTTAAGVASDITVHTLRVKAEVAAMGVYRGLSEDHLYEMEYDLFQQAKRRRAQSLPLSGQIAIVTGAAGAIGSGIVRELLQQGSAVAACDLPGVGLTSLVAQFGAEFGERIMGVPFDVTDQAQVAQGFARIVVAWGGVDIVVANAGIALVAPLARMDVAAFRQLEQVNVEGTLHMLAEAARLFERQGTGGDIILVSTKNVFAPGAKFGAYSATKAAAHQLARIASLELAEMGVRVNMVAPDAVFGEGARKSGLWAAVGPDRMKERGLDEKGLEEYYRNRNLLKARITPKHVANALLYFATRQTPTTGATIPVDGGLPDATPR
jgi:NAD(P)-dependent dehydrogenase (short-subunit alcohol dehydrogenase family)